MSGATAPTGTAVWRDYTDRSASEEREGLYGHGVKKKGLKRTPRYLSLLSLSLSPQREFECLNEGGLARGRTRQGENERGSSHPRKRVRETSPPPPFPPRKAIPFVAFVAAVRRAQSHEINVSPLLAEVSRLRRSCHATGVLSDDGAAGG